MKKYIPALVLMGAFPIILMAQVVAPSLPLPVPVDPNQDFINLLIQSIGGLKGASTLVIVGVAVQLLLKLMNTTWIKLDASIKLLAVSGLGVVGGVVGLMVPPNNLPIGAAIVHATTLTAFMVFFNQIYQKWLAPKADTPKV